jgi:hypothetical protein
MTLGAPLVRFRPEDCPAMPARRRTGNENLRKKFQSTAKWPDSTIDIAAQLLPPGGRVKTATLPRQGNSSIKLTAFGAVFLFENQQLVRFHWHALRTRACHPGRADGANESTSTQSLALIGFS